MHPLVEIRQLGHLAREWQQLSGHGALFRYPAQFVGHAAHFLDEWPI